MKSILNRSLRISNISELNDPYDMMLGITDFPAGYEEEVDTFSAALHMRDHMSEHAGVLCFSGKYREPVMWAHYANNHKGMCLVFDPSVLPVDALKKVRYTNTRPTVPFGLIHQMSEDGGNQEYLDAFYDALVAKSAAWEYEEEYRLVLMISDKEDYDGFFPIPKGFLKRVIVGFDCDYSPSNVRSLLNSSGFEDVPIQITRLSQDKFEVDALDYVRVDMGDITPDQTDLVEQKMAEAMEAWTASQDENRVEQGGAGNPLPAE